MNEKEKLEDFQKSVVQLSDEGQLRILAIQRALAFAQGKTAEPSFHGDTDSRSA